MRTLTDEEEHELERLTAEYKVAEREAALCELDIDRRLWSREETEAWRVAEMTAQEAWNALKAYRNTLLENAA